MSLGIVQTSRQLARMIQSAEKNHETVLIKG
jgi:hypothetical protein